MPDAPTPTPGGKQIPHRIGLGLAALGRPGYINLGHAQDLPTGHGVQAMRQQAFGVLDAAYEGGVRYFDAARSYGLAETFLAEWLESRDIGPAQVSVGSKWGYTYTADWQVLAAQHEIKEHSLSSFERQWPETRSLLGGWLNVYLAHSVTPGSPLLHDTALQERLLGLRELGVVPGVSLSGPQQSEVLQEALALKIGGVPVFGAVQATWNLLEPSAGQALSTAHAAGWKVIVKEAVANGRLTSRGEPLPETLHALCQKHQTTPDALALAAVLAQPFAGVVLSGASTVSHLESNLTALRVRLSADDLSALGRLRETPETYWQTRARLPWN